MIVQLISSLCLASATVAEKFSEELLLRQAPTGHIYTHFRFNTLWESDIRDVASREHLNLVPRTLGDIISTFSVQELKLTLTQGIWRTEKWGYPVESAPPGGLVVARFLRQVENVDDAWEGLTSALAGLLCASLNKLDRRESVEPVYTFANQGIIGQGLDSNTTLLRYGLLPRENLCTENLTPWKKLLPCKSKRGLATLLNSPHIQKFSNFFSVGLQIRPVCYDSECVVPGIELKQSVSIVFDPVILNKKADNIDWSLKQLFGIGLTPACPLAETSSVFIDTTDAGYQLEPEPQQILDYGSGMPRKIAVYDVKTFAAGGIKNIAAKHSKPHIYGIVRSPSLLISRHVVGTGQEKGGIVTTIRNSCSSPVTGVYLDVIPWYLRVYLHTLRIDTNGIQVEPVKLVYRPGRDREKPYHLELVLNLPARSLTTIKIDTEYSVLRWTEYPPDANHGFYIGAAVLSARLPKDSLHNLTQSARESWSLNYLFWGNAEIDPVIQIFTETLLVTMPTPDFSMPYNVICLACTVAALAFGPIHNITTKQLVLVLPEDEEKTPLASLIAPFVAIFYKIINKLKKKPAVVVEPTNIEEKDKDDNESEGKSEDVPIEE